MNNPERQMNAYPWVPFHQRPSRLPGPRPQGAANNRQPRYFLRRDGGEVHFVNASDETLTSVTGEDCWLTSNFGDGLDVFARSEPKKFEGVQPDEAVRLHALESRTADDFLVATTVTIELDSGESLKLQHGRIGGPGSWTVLLWENGHTGKHVNELDQDPQG